MCGTPCEEGWCSVCRTHERKAGVVCVGLHVRKAGVVCVGLMRGRLV